MVVPFIDGVPVSVSKSQVSRPLPGPTPGLPAQAPATPHKAQAPAAPAVKTPANVAAQGALGDVTPIQKTQGPVVSSGVTTGHGANAAAAVKERPPVKATAEFDYVVVGSGAGGGPTAARLAEAGYKVLVLEGGVDKNVKEAEPLILHGAASEHKDLLVDGQGYFIHHNDKMEDNLKDPKFVKEKDGVFVPRGEGIGGSTRMNAGIFVRPDDVDWDNIAKITGDKTWDAKNMAGFFQKVENAQYQPVLKFLHMVGKGLNIESLQNLGGHGFDGWLKVNRPLDLDLVKSLVKNPQLIRIAWETVKFNFKNVGTTEDKLKSLLSLFDPNHNLGNNTQGFVMTPLTVTKDGRRNNVRERLQDVQAKHPDKLSIVSGAKVHSVVLDDNKEVTGVRYRDQTGKMHTVAVGREAILAAGAFETPAIMMRSGIGPKEELAKLAPAGVEAKVELEGVGKGLKGRYEVGVVTRLKEPLPLLTETELSADPNNPAYKKWLETGKGAFATNGIVAAFRVKSDPSLPEPDLYVFAVPGKFEGYKPGYSVEAAQDPNLVTWVILDENKGDRHGEVKLDPNNIEGQPKVNQKFHDDERGGDTKPLVNGIKIVRDLVKQYGDIVAGEEWPGPTVKTDAELATAVKQNSWDHHPNGTAAIGADGDPKAVLNSKMEVRGVKGLRVSDASIFPANMGSFIQSAILTASEKCAGDLIETAQKQDAQKGLFTPLGLRLNQEISPKRTLNDNVFVAMHDARKLGRDGVMTPAALKELVTVTAKNGFSARELQDAQTIATALQAKGDPNAKILAQLADAIAVGRADQGFLKNVASRLNDLRAKSELPSLAWTDKKDSPAQVTQWKKEIGELQKTLLDKSGKLTEVGRAFHQKQLFGGMGQATVRDDVPSFLRFGPFEKPGASLTSAVRFSNGQGCPFKDSDPDVRGVAVKLVDQQGKPWDMLMTNQESSHARNTEQFMKFAKVSGKLQTEGNLAGLKDVTTGLLKGQFDGTETVRIGAQLAKDTKLHMVESLTTETYNGGTFKTPDGHLAKMVMMPADGAQARNVDKRDPDWLGKELEAQMKAGPVKMVLGIQLYTGDGKNPDPTDANARWGSPVYPVADLVLPGNARNQKDAAALINQMAFNPGNGFAPAEMTTTRKELYAESAKNRGAISQEDAVAAMQKLAAGGAP